MRKYILLLGLNFLILAGIDRYFRIPEVESESLSYRFTFVCPQTWDSVMGGIEAADMELGTDTKCLGFKNLNEDRQVLAIRNAIYANVDGIITAGTNASDKLADVIEEAQKEGIPVVLVNDDLPESERTCYIGMDHRAAGELAGRDMAEAAGEDAHIGIIVSSLSDQNQKERVEGFCSAMGEGAVVEQVLECDSDKMRVRQLVQQMLLETKTINAIYCADEIAAEMLGEILKTEGYLTTDMHVVCMGMSEQIYEYIQEGRYDASIVQENYKQGYQAVSYLKDCLNGMTGGESVIYTGVESAKKGYDFEAWRDSWENAEGEWKLL